MDSTLYALGEKVLISSVKTIYIRLKISRKKDNIGSYTYAPPFPHLAVSNHNAHKSQNFPQEADNQAARYHQYS